MDFGFTEEQLLFKEQVIKFAQKEIVPRVQEHDYQAKFDFEAFRKMGEFGLLGLHFPEKYGGSDADVVTAVLAGEALGEAGVDGGLTLAYGAHTFLCADTIFCHGTEAHREKYLPKLNSGKWIGCMALTEPGAGSDVASMKTYARKEGNKYILNGQKIFMTNGPIADVAVVYAKTDREVEAHNGISAFVVEKGTPGFSTGAPLKKMGVKSSQTSELFFEDCEIPEENLLGKEGNGFLMAMQTVEWDRCALLAPAIGSMAYALQQGAEYSVQRVQFARPIAKFQAIKHKLADVKIFLEAARGLIYRIAYYKDQNRPLNHLEAAVAKLFVGDWSMDAANQAMMIFGGYGYCSEYNMERIFRDSRLAPLGGGTSDIQKMIISKLI